MYLVLTCTNWVHFPRSNWNLEMLVFEERGKSTRRKTPRSREENQQQTLSTYYAGSGKLSNPWWEVSALTTASSLLPPKKK